MNRARSGSLTGLSRGFASASSKTYYEILDNLPTSSSQKEIKSKFYELSMRFHPDRNPDDEEAHAAFLRISEAYSVLGNEQKRLDYDRDLQATRREFRHAASSPAYAGRQAWSSRSYREQLRPDDWILYRNPGGGTRPGSFNFDAHQKGHYGNKSSEGLRPTRDR
ncbi:hypothetical protein HDU91_007287 [Kappamyces sp. JEL0680]|nr:hypothetical protein HDU91_007287 [Kappamyces sp. JEL0680]